MEKLLKFAILFLLVVLLSVSCVALYNVKFNLPFEPVERIAVDDIPDSELAWFSLRDEKYSGFFTLEKLTEYGVDASDLNLDFSHYTYIVTCGHELRSIKYSLSLTKNRRFLFIPKQFVGIIELQYDPSPYVYIYRVKKLDIDCDYHERSKNVYYVK
jgi:hypothetical protein